MGEDFVFWGLCPLPPAVTPVAPTHFTEPTPPSAFAGLTEKGRGHRTHAEWGLEGGKATAASRRQHQIGWNGNQAMLRGVGSANETPQ